MSDFKKTAICFSMAALLIACSEGNSFKEVGSKKDSVPSKVVESKIVDGVWHDTTTGLVWMRCYVGQDWNGKTCIGEPVTLRRQDIQDYMANFGGRAGAGYSDWRLPKIEELAAIRRCPIGWTYESVRESRITSEGRKDVEVDRIIDTQELPNGQKVPQRCRLDLLQDAWSVTFAPIPPQKERLYDRSLWSSTIHGEYVLGIDSSDGSIGMAGYAEDGDDSEAMVLLVRSE